MRLSLLRCRICLLPATKIVLRLLNLIGLAVDDPLTNIYIYINSIKQSVSKKVGASARALLEPFQHYGSQNEFCCCLSSSPVIFSKDSYIICRKKSVFDLFFGIFILFDTKLTATSALIRSRTFFLRKKNVFLLFLCLRDISFGILFCRKDCLNLHL